MSSTSLVIGYASGYPKSPEDAQERALVAFGIDAGDIIVNGRTRKGYSPENWLSLFRKARSGDTIAVTKLRAIYAPKGRETPRQALFRAIHESEIHGCTIVEISTGLLSSVARERDKMIAACLDELARARAGGDAGRPKRELTKDEHALGRRHWYDLQHKTNAAAVAAARAEAKKLRMHGLLRLRSPQAYTNVFGASGRAKLRRKSKR
jgi:hypothetical protein